VAGALGLAGRWGYYAWHRLRATFGDRRPLLGGLKLTHDCNLECAHCPFWRKAGPSLSLEGASEAMRRMRAMGVRILIVEGGEPFLWRSGEHDLGDVVAEGRELFFCLGVTTNGTFPIETEADVVWVSVDGLRETHDRIRGRTFDRIMANIAASSHPKIYAHVTINSLNVEEIPALVEHLAGVVKGVTVQFHYPYEGLDESYCLSPEQRVRVLDELIALKRRGLPVADSVACLQALKGNNWKCHSWMIASADPDGRVVQGCYVKGRGRISCERCGFSAHTEMSLAFDGRPGAMLTGQRIFSRPGN
jgi:MoaA/NifB/PqqE/SkfB family radical SAM enzyme